MTQESAGTTATGPHRSARAVRLVAILLASAGVLLAAALAGAAGRTYLGAPAVVRCAAPEDALAAWRRAGVRGRVLVLFARDVAMSAGSGPPFAGSYVLRAVDEGIVRRVYHVIPDDAWDEVRSALAAFPEAERTEGAFRLWPGGVPLTVLRRSDLPRVREPILAAVEADRWSPEALRDISASLRQDGTADLVAWWGNAPEGVAVLEGMGRAAP